MNEYIKKFFKSKLNITMFILQIIAIIFICFAQFWNFAFIILLLSEGLFFIVLGIKFIYQNKVIDKNLEMFNKLPYEDKDPIKTDKKLKWSKKSNILQAILYFMMGLCLIVIAIF